MKLKIGNIFLWSSLVITVSLFVLAKTTDGDTLTLSWLNLSKLLSLTGTTLLAFSFLLSSRLFFLEAWFGGLDKVYRIHHIVGGIAFVLLLHHPIFLLFDVLPDLDFGWRYFWFSELTAYNWGILTLYFMSLMIILTLFIRLPYSVWKKTHEFMGVILILASFHILTISSDVNRPIPLRYWILFLLFMAITSAFYRRFLYGVIGPKFKYLVKKVETRNNVLVVDLAPLDRKMNPWPGQFVFTRFDGFGNEQHPFSLSSISPEGDIQLGIKILGDHTAEIASLNVNTVATLWGPYGRFWEGYIAKKDLIMIAGGIGITPFLSMIQREVKLPTDRKVNLIYCVKDGKEAVFDHDIEEMTRDKSNINYTLYTSEVSGRIDATKIIGIVGTHENKKIMICGPIPMMNSLADQFTKLGVKNKDIIFEDFNLR